MEQKIRILVVDDETEMRALLHDYLMSEGFDVLPFANAKDALQTVAAQPNSIDVVISDIKMAPMDGLQLLKQMKQDWPSIPVILVTAYGSIDTAIEAMRSGAYNYIVKPFKLTEVRAILEKALEQRALRRDNELLRQEVHKSWKLGDVIGRSAAMKTVFDLVQRVSGSTANVLITGESGSGKEVIARAIHNMGPRANKPFVPINCTAIPESLLESELFGHEKGAFTGAYQRKPGLFQEAHGGTLFLDEIGDMAPPLQAKLLRVLQDRKVRPIGSSEYFDIDVRIICATHKNLRELIKHSLFREDLYYRISVIPIQIPSLRERPEDVPLLADHFIKKYAAANGSPAKQITKRALAKLLKFRWQGNVRELENIIERAVVMAPPLQEYLDEKDIPDAEVATAEEFFKTATASMPTLSALEEKYIRLVLDKTAGRKDRTAQILGISRRTLYRKEREYGFVTAEGVEEDFGDDDRDIKDDHQ